MENLFDIVKRQGYCLIAEIGVNYYEIALKEKISTLEAAKLMCKRASIAGADAVKFQSYKAETLASIFSPSYWDLSEENTSSQYELFKKYDSFEAKDYIEIANYCQKEGIVFLSTPFDFDSVDYLCDIMGYYKISSSDITNLPFIEYIAEKNKPIILSTGAANEEEIRQAVECIERNGNDLVLMHCVLEYPTPKEHANLSRITALKNKYPNLEIGYSDHTKPTDKCEIMMLAYALGARYIEKHFTLDKSLKGNDHYHAMDEQDLRNIKKCLNDVAEMLGTADLQFQDTELAARSNARRSIVLARALEKGHCLSRKDVMFKRPGIGISPAECNRVLGMNLKRNMAADEILRWEDVESDDV